MKGFKFQPDVLRAHNYAKKVASGKLPAAKHHRLACQRHIDDLQRKDFEFTFNAEEAQRVCSVLKMFVHTKGKWAGQPFIMEDWQAFMTVSLFGWQSKKTGSRRFTEAYICVPRKSGKSQWAGAVGNYMHTLDGENGAEVYCGARTEKQAWEVFGPARLMAKKTPSYAGDCDVLINAKGLVRLEDNSRFEPVVGDPGDGSSPSCFILDERHEHRNDNMYDTARTGMGARAQPLLLSITTAGSSIGGVCYRQQKQAEKVLEKALDNERLFVMIFGIDDEDDWTSKEALYKANPNIGVSISEEFLLAQQKQATQDASKASAFQTKHLNRWTGAQQAWMNMVEWAQCEDTTWTLEDLEGQDCIRAIDLASKRDFACYMKLFPVDAEKTTYWVHPTFYLPENTIMEDRSGLLAPWVAEGWLKSTEGSEIDFGVIESDILADEAKYNFKASAYDAWQAQQFATNLKKEGIDMTPYGNGPSKMTEPMNELLAAVGAKRLKHNGNPIMTWMMSNVVAKSQDGGDTFKPVKENADSKIDGGVCLIMALGANMRIEEPEQKANIYANRGIRTL